MEINANTKTIVVNFDEYKNFSSVQNADFDMSISWKKNSKKLFTMPKDYLPSFKDAIIWCGKNGNVIRTVSSNNLDSFCNFLFSNLTSIRNGTFLINKTPEFTYTSKNGGKTMSTKPYSWVSKVCHIINPTDYPIIYDSIVNKALNIRSINDYINSLECIKSKLTGETKMESCPFFVDSFLWAKYKSA